MKISNSQTKLTEKEISQLESETDISLPDDYRAFLLKYNGGEPDPAVFETKDGKVESLVTKFLPLANISGDNLLEEIEGITQAGQIPENLIPIAVDPADNRVVLSVDGADRSKVYYWAWDEEDEDHKPSKRYMRLIADSFNQFFNSLH